MRTVISICGVICLLLFIQGCKKALAVNDYVHYVRDVNNGLCKTVAIDGWEYIVQYRPYDYILLQENNNKENKKRRNELSGTACFTIKIKRGDNSVSPLRYNLSSHEEYDKRLNYFLNEAGKNIRLLYDNKDTLYPVAYEFENNYNLTPEETMMVGFILPGKAGRPQKDMQLSYDDEVFKNGIIKVKIKKDDLNNIPDLTE